MVNSFIEGGRFHFGHPLVHRVFGRDGGAADPAVHLIVAFDALYMIGLVFLGAILFTVGRSFHIKRASTWFMFILSWFLTSLSNLLILGQQTGPSPRAGVCLAQAMLIYAMPVFASLYAVAFLLQVHLSIRNAVNGSSMTLQRMQIIMVHTLPCALFCAILIEVLVLGLLHPETVERHPSGMYCHLSNVVPNQVTAAITIAAMITFLILGSLVFFELRRKWQAVQAMSSKVNNQPQISPDVATRVLIFSFCPIIALAISSIQYIPHHGANIASQINILMATLPILAGLIFGSQRDILRVWANCVQRNKNTNYV